MFELFLTYWFSWILFIIIMFFFEKSQLRSFLIIGLLLMLILFPVKVTVFATEVSIVLIVMFSFAIILFVRDKVTFLRIVITLMMTLAYIGLLFWEKISPIWFFMPTFIIVSIMIVIITILLQQDLFQQFSSLLLSVLFAQLLYDLFLKVYFLHNELSNDAILIIVFSTLLLMMVYFFRISFQKVFHH